MWKESQAQMDTCIFEFEESKYKLLRRTEEIEATNDWKINISTNFNYLKIIKKWKKWKKQKWPVTVLINYEVFFSICS